MSLRLGRHGKNLPRPSLEGGRICYESKQGLDRHGETILRPDRAAPAGGARAWARLPCVAAVRGKGLLAAMEFNSDIVGRVVTHANEAGVLLNAVRPNAVRFMPPLTITVEEVDEAAERLEEALKQL